MALQYYILGLQYFLGRKGAAAPRALALALQLLPQKKNFTVIKCHGTNV